MARIFWDYHVTDHANYIRGYNEGVGAPSREWVARTVGNVDNLLDVGCGSGCEYESLVRHHQKAIKYRGIDYSGEFVRACQGLFPEGDFRLGDARKLQEPDHFWDWVLLRHILEHVPDYRPVVLEAMRVARKGVIVVNWKPLHPDRDHIQDLGDDGWSSEWHEGDFLDFLRGFHYPIEYRHFPAQGSYHENWGWLIRKSTIQPGLVEPRPQVVFDLDDFGNNNHRLDQLLRLWGIYPHFKVTLFTIPLNTNAGFRQLVGPFDWMELAVHGWSHKPNQECMAWTLEEAHHYLEQAEAMGVFVKGFKAPGWRINGPTLQALVERGYWLAHHVDYKNDARGYPLRIYWSHQPVMVHGHVQDIENPNPQLQNGLAQLIAAGLPFGRNTAFHFVSEVVHE